jgi:ribosomal protein L39E
MAHSKPAGKKRRLGKAAEQTKWAPFWTVPKIYKGRFRIHPGRHTAVKRHWKRTKLKV